MKKIVISAKKKKWDPNPWAVCHTTVDKEKNPEKYERCVQDVKKKQKKAFETHKLTKIAGNSGIYETEVTMNDETLADVSVLFLEDNGEIYILSIYSDESAGDDISQNVSNTCLQMLPKKIKAAIESNSGNIHFEQTKEAERKRVSLQDRRKRWFDEVNPFDPENIKDREELKERELKDKWEKLENMLRDISKKEREPVLSKSKKVIVSAVSKSAKKWIQKAVDEEDEGKFTQWCKDHGYENGVCQSCIDEAAQKGGHAAQMANFAVNASQGKYTYPDD